MSLESERAISNAQALLDALKKHVFFDDVQIARLLCERAPGERDRILVKAVKRA